MEDGVSTVCVERAAIGERDGKLLEPVDEMIGVRNAAYVVGCEVVPYLEAPMPRHRRDLTIDETCSLRCDLLAEIFGDAGKKRASRIRYEILGRVGRRHGKAGLHGAGLAILRLGKDAKIKRRGGYTTKAMTATTHDFLPLDTLSQAQVSAKLSPREVQARAKVAAYKSPANLSIADERRRHIAFRSHVEPLLLICLTLYRLDIRVNHAVGVPRSVSARTSRISATSLTAMTMHLIDTAAATTDVRRTATPTS